MQKICFEMLHKRMKLLGLLSVIMTTLATVAHASEAVELSTELVAEVREVVGSARGAQERPLFRLAPATTLAQGQEVYYTVRITNPTPVFANKVVVDQKIPANTRYVARSAAGPGVDIEFSIDGGQTFARPEDLGTEDGSTRAPPERYTHIRWRFHNPLAPGAVALARFRATFK